MSYSNEKADDFFFQQATLDEECFFAALVAAGYPDLSCSPLSTFIYRGTCYDPNGRPTAGVLLSTLRAKLQILKEALHVFSELADGPHPAGIPTTDRKRCMTMGLAALSPEGRSMVSEDNFERVKNLMDPESFARYNLNQDGVLNVTDVCAFVITIRILCDVYLETVEDPRLGLDVVAFNQALQRLGLPNVERTLQGQFVKAVFERADLDGNNYVCLSEFIRAGTRLEYPVIQETRIRDCVGYPGWSALAMDSSVEQSERIADFVSSLNTGDLLLFQGGHDAMPRFIKFSMNTPWSHVAVVVKRSPLGGIANEKTEEVLQKFPFRRAAHNFCSPGYCRCFDLREGNFPPSHISGCDQVGLLESTGEGIHLYDAAHRLFESPSMWQSIAVAQLHDVPGDRDDADKINSFVESVRGGIYSVAKDELAAAISFHSGAATLPEGNRSSDDFCASLAMRFYRHMGWIDDSRPCNSVMPSDFDVYTEYSMVKNPVELIQGRIGHLELIKSPELGVTLPLKLPRKK